MMAPADAPVFQAAIVPHRSLSRAGRISLLAAIGAICATIAGLFVHFGAWPVSGFAGAEWLLAAVLMRSNVRAARSSELVLLHPSALRILRTAPDGKQHERVLQPAWLQLVLEDRPGRAPRLVLQSGREREEIASSLGEAQKRDLAAALAQALDRLRNPTFDNPQLRA
jgi:uncharacterized membrane protein